MSKSQLYIPNKINVGYQKRGDTYTGKLAYIIYWDNLGKLRKEPSWNSWRDTKIANNEFENVPTEGFVLNKGVGGARQSYGWNARNEYIRVYDPRGFEFEISVANLLFILQEATSTKGKGLEGEFVYCWEGKDLMLLPLCSQEYKESNKFTELQTRKITKEDMTPGCTYIDKQEKELIYLGRFDYTTFEYARGESYDYITTTKKHHIFVDANYDTKNSYGNKYVLYPGFTKLVVKVSDEISHNYSDLVTEFYNSKYGSLPVEIILKPTDVSSGFKEDRWGNIEGSFVRETTNGYIKYNIKKETKYNHLTNTSEIIGYCYNDEYEYYIKDKKLTRKYSPSTYYYGGNKNTKIYTMDELLMEDYKIGYIKLESGSKMKLNKY